MYYECPILKIWLFIVIIVGVETKDYLKFLRYPLPLIFLLTLSQNVRWAPCKKVPNDFFLHVIKKTNHVSSLHIHHKTHPKQKYTYT